MIIRFLIEKEFKQILRNSFLPRMIVAFPIIMMLVIPWVTNLEVKNIQLRVVDNDRSTLSLRLVHEMEASNYFIFKGLSPSYEAALQEIERGKADLVAVIPYHYEHDIRIGETPKVLIAANSVNGTKGSMGSAYLSQIITSQKSNQSKLSLLNLFNIHQDYKVFMIPALMVILLTLMCGFMPALNIVGEKEIGTIEQINVTPVSKFTFILAKLIPYWIIGLVIMSICFLLSWLVYDIVPSGSLLLIYTLAILFSFTMSGIGQVVSNYSDTMQQAMFVMWFIMVCTILLSGLFTPVSSMPAWAQDITIINPLKYFINGMRTVFIRGGGIPSVVSELSSLALFALVMNIWAVRSYRKNS